MSESGKINIKNVRSLLLWCRVCDEKKILWTDEMNGGHSWDAAVFIADEFDKFHDEECE